MYLLLCLLALCLMWLVVVHVVRSLCGVLVWCVEWCWLSSMIGSCVWVVASVVRSMMSIIRVSSVVCLLV